MWKIYSKNGLLLDSFNDGVKALEAYNNWPQAYTIFYCDEIIRSK